MVAHLFPRCLKFKNTLSTGIKQARGFKAQSSFYFYYTQKACVSCLPGRLHICRLLALAYSSFYSQTFPRMAVGVQPYGQSFSAKLEVQKKRYLILIQVYRLSHLLHEGCYMSLCSSLLSVQGLPSQKEELISKGCMKHYLLPSSNLANW